MRSKFFSLLTIAVLWRSFRVIAIRSIGRSSDVGRDDAARCLANTSDGDLRCRHEHRERLAASTSPRSPTSSRARCAGTSASRCTPWRYSPRSRLSARTTCACHVVGSRIDRRCHLDLPLAAGAVPEHRCRRVLDRVPCDLVWFEKFGFITLPFMALTALPRGACRDDSCPAEVRDMNKKQSGPRRASSDRSRDG